jgi:hypothetical protein
MLDNPIANPMVSLEERGTDVGVKKETHGAISVRPFLRWRRFHSKNLSRSFASSAHEPKARSRDELDDVPLSLRSPGFSGRTTTVTG